MDLFDSAENQRDEALDRVASRSGKWMPAAMAALRKCRGIHRWPQGFTGEELRHRLLLDGCPRPHHHNAWGALINQAVRIGLVQATGERRNMRGPRSHARSTSVYVWG